MLHNTSRLICSLFIITSLLGVSYSVEAYRTQSTQMGLENIKKDLTDASITSAIKLKYSGDSLLSVFRISVTTDRGIVTLSGDVKSAKEYERAITTAYSTQGVRDVDAENLRISNRSLPIEDSLITAKLNGLLLKDKILKDIDSDFWSIQVTTSNRVVHLRGSVENKRQRDRVIALAKQIKGVASVDSRLKLRNNA